MAQRIVIWEKEGANMTSSWTDRFVCTRRKDGTFSLRHFSVGAEGIFSIAGYTRIKSAQLFVELLLEMDGSIGPDEIRGEMCKKIENIDPAFAKKVRTCFDEM